MLKTDSLKESCEFRLDLKINGARWNFSGTKLIYRPEENLSQCFDGKIWVISDSRRVIKPISTPPPFINELDKKNNNKWTFYLNKLQVIDKDSCKWEFDFNIKKWRCVKGNTSSDLAAPSAVKPSPVSTSSTTSLIKDFSPVRTPTVSSKFSANSKTEKTALLNIINGINCKNPDDWERAFLSEGYKVIWLRRRHSTRTDTDGYYQSEDKNGSLAVISKGKLYFIVPTCNLSHSKLKDVGLHHWYCVKTSEWPITVTDLAEAKFEDGCYKKVQPGEII